MVSALWACLGLTYVCEQGLPLPIEAILPYFDDAETGHSTCSAWRPP